MTCLAKISLENPVMLGFSEKLTKLETMVEQTGPLKSDNNEDLGDDSIVEHSRDYRFPVQLVQTHAKVPCGSRLAVLISVLKHLFEKEGSNKCWQDARPEDSLLFLQPVEIDYLKDLERHAVKLTEYPIIKVLESFPFYGKKFHAKSFVTLDAHPWVLSLQNALESFVSTEANINKLTKSTYCSWICAYTVHRGELENIFMVKKLHLGHVAKSFSLKEQPFVGGEIIAETREEEEERLKAEGFG
ncbi:hypothetical protein SAY86_010200 [Trapa natans]|uniref:ATP-dependent rRNA helicase SPB4-like C-terminal extension domain-containing protein n=1 Tax=Trapa natans TaxID=22666 RepID=A0AAN7QTM3_TRANT|nr:hypothetical protein SAY86_010200 [Trapa natans]